MLLRLYRTYCGSHRSCAIVFRRPMISMWLRSFVTFYFYWIFELDGRKNEYDFYEVVVTVALLGGHAFPPLLRLNPKGVAVEKVGWAGLF